VATRASASQTQGQNTDVRPVVAGVDTGGRSMSAVLWAAGEAQNAGRALRLVSAYPDDAGGPGRAAKRDELAEVARRLTVADLDYDVGIGSPATVLLDAAAEGALLVVGRRGHSAVQHRLLGSTSVAVVARSPVPVVVVPEEWLQAGPSSDPVVVGVQAPDHDVLVGAEVEHAGAADRDQDALRFAFERAERLQVPLVVLSAIEVPLIYGWSPEDVAASKQRAADAVSARLRGLREAHPDVEVDVECPAEIPGRALLESSRVAQVTVLGRHGGGQLPRMTLGGTTRGVLEHADRPIAVVPVMSGAPSEERQ
jgi:nucleotide-binding universal stress UspA family protein